MNRAVGEPQIGATEADDFIGKICFPSLAFGA
jgi:hypothetical protein